MGRPSSHHVAHDRTCRGRLAKGGQRIALAKPAQPVAHCDDVARVRAADPWSKVLPGGRSAGDARGNSRQFRHSLFSLSELCGSREYGYVTGRPIRLQ